MQGYFTFASDGEQRIGLSKDVDFLCSDKVSKFEIAQNPSPGLVKLAAIRWAWNSSGWLIEKLDLDCEMKLEGGMLPSGTQIPLSSGSRLQVDGTEFRFEKVQAEPKFNGLPFTEINVEGIDSVIFGRGSTPASDASDTASTGAEGDVYRIDLEPENRRISSKHVQIEKEGGRYYITDLSKFGALLNGIVFKREVLVYGDRFSIEDYVFEFRVDIIRRIDHEVGGMIQARDLTVEVENRAERGKKDEKIKILQDVSIDVTPGEFVGIIGGSGEGKSTLMNALCGINPATSGKVMINGIEVSDREAMVAAGIGYVPQDDIVHLELSVRDAVTLCGRLRLNLPDSAIDDLVSKVINSLGLEPHANKRIRNLSGGQRKRVSIATELLSRPSVLFLDEPSSGLDPATEDELTATLQNLSKTGMTVVCTTHVMENSHLFDKLLIVKGGRIAFYGDHLRVRDHFLGSGMSVDESLSQSRGRKLASMSNVYKKLSQGSRTPMQWQELYEGSMYYQKLAPQLYEREGKQALDKTRRVGIFSTLKTLVSRQWKVLVADPLNVLFLFAQALLIALMIGWVAEGPVLRGFLAIVATLWFGCSNGAQQIVSELPIFRRERVSGQGLNAYIFSKFSFLTSLTALQAIVLLLVLYGATHVFHPDDLSDGRDRKLKDALVDRFFPLPVEENRSNDIEAVETIAGVESTNALKTRVVRGHPGLIEIVGTPDLYFTTKPEDWEGGKTVFLSNYKKVILPDTLPPYPENGIVAEEVTHGAVESPFAPGSWKVYPKSAEENWVPLANVSCPLTGQVFSLPKKLPAWPSATIEYGFWKGFVRFFFLTDVFLDGAKEERFDGRESVPTSQLVSFTLGLKLIALGLTALVGVAIGLMISALVQNVTQAVMWVPLVLIPQILFGGFVVKVPEMTESVQKFSQFVPSYAAQRVMDVSHIYGRLVPKVTNQTKLPVFSDGAGEVVKWEDEKQSQRYERAVSENVSWQNLLVWPDLVGKRKIDKNRSTLYVKDGFLSTATSMGAREVREASDFKQITDTPQTVDDRRDVRPGYDYGTRFVYLAPAQVAMIILCVWLLTCYIVILIGLANRQTGK